MTEQFFLTLYLKCYGCLGSITSQFLLDILFFILCLDRLVPKSMTEWHTSIFPRSMAFKGKLLEASGVQWKMVSSLRLVALRASCLRPVTFNGKG